MNEAKPPLNYRFMIYTWIMGFLCFVGGMALMGWGAYVSCHDGGGHLLNGWRPMWICISDDATIPICTIPGQEGYYQRAFIIPVQDQPLVNVSWPEGES